MDLHDSTKVCSHCRQRLDISSFRKNRQKKDGLHPQCKACEREYALANKERIAAFQAQYRELNKERIDAQKAEYRRMHRDEILAKKASYRAANPDKVRESKRRSYEANKPHYLAKAKAFHDSHPALIREVKRAWSRRNPAKKQELRMRYNARKVNATIEPVDYDAIYHRDQGICHICHNPVPRCRLQYDHVIPLSKGGAHSMENVKVSHAHCNFKKGDKIL